MFFFGNNYYLETKKKLYLICNILKLRPIRTQNFLNNRNILRDSRDIRRKKNLKILKLRFFEIISRFKKYKNVKFAVFEIA